MRLLIAAFTLTLGPIASATPSPPLDVPYIKTPPAVVERMLDMAQVTPNDILIDLGSGDGRIPIAAARNGTQALGVDLDPERTTEARAAAEAAGVADRATFRTENLFDTDLTRATVISMYLFPEINLRLRPHLLQLEPGTRVVSHAFHMDEWTPDRHDVVEGRDIFLWVIPARLEGLWRVTADDGHRFVLRAWQQFNRVQGVAITIDEHSVPVANMTVSGRQVAFTVKTGDGERRYTGELADGRLQGTVSTGGGWQAERMP